MKITVTVKPGSRKGPLVEEQDGSLILYVREPAAEGKANAKVTILIAEHYGVPKSAVKILRGTTSKVKIIEVDR